MYLKPALRTSVLPWLILASAGCAASDRQGRATQPTPTSQEHPNFVILFADDLGYGDVGCFGATDIRTPCLDRMADQGMRLTGFYSQPVCGPARAALMTGCYPTRVMRGKWTLPTEEITVAELLKQRGYATACIGKWDLSGRRHVDGLVPNDQGFDYYFGTLGANDRGRVSLMENREPRGETDDMGSLTGLYTEKAVRFIRENKSRPFFLYLAHTMPHVVIGASERFRGKSQRGLYGDVVEELDGSVGQVLDTIRDCGLDGKTVVVFMSDNGPWLSKREMGGSAGPLRNGKGSAWEGGVRVPCIVWAPGRVPAGRVSDEMVATLDVLPTFARWAGAAVPKDRVIDGKDQSDLLTGKSSQGARGSLCYYVRDNLHAVRQGRWKLALAGRREFYKYAQDDPPLTAPQLFDLHNDIGETTDLAAQHPAVVQQLLHFAEAARADIGDLERIGGNARSRPE